MRWADADVLIHAARMLEAAARRVREIAAEDNADVPPALTLRHRRLSHARANIDAALARLPEAES